MLQRIGISALAVMLLTLDMSPGGAMAEIRIGVAGPETGQFRVLGEQMRIGAAEAVADINAAGGINGERLTLEAADDKCESEKAAAIANQLVGRNVVAVIGHLCSAASVEAAAIYNAAGIIQISPASAGPAYTDNRPDPAGGTYRLFGREDDQPKIAGRFLAERFGAKRVAFLNDGTAYGKGLADGALSAFEDAGGSAVLTRSFEAGLTDYSSLVAILDSQRIDLLYLGGYHTEAGLIALKLRQRGMETVMMGGDALLTEEFRVIARDAADGTLVTYAPDPRENPPARSLTDRLRARGIEPELFTMHAYAAVQIWAEAARKAGTVGYNEVTKVINEGRFDTVIGTVAFDSKGDMSLPGYVVYEWRDGWYEELADLY